MEASYVGLVATEDTRHKSLTPREWEFLELMAQGLTNPKIAEKLFIHLGTVNDLSVRVYAKLGLARNSGLNPRVQATLWYWGITTESLSSRNGV